jgi:CHAT domain-containing protein
VRHEIVNLPSISVLASFRSEALKRKSAPKDIMVLADPVFSANDKRVKAGTLQGVTEIAVNANQESEMLPDRNDLDRLPSTRREAKGIVALAPLSRTKKALDFVANRELVESAELSKYRYGVFATHGLFGQSAPGNNRNRAFSCG